MALHDVCQGRREFVALMHTAAGNALLPEKKVAFDDAVDKAQQRRYGFHIASVMVQRVRKHGQLLANKNAILTRVALHVRQHATPKQHNVAVFDVAPHRPGANIPKKAYGLVERVGDGSVHRHDNVIDFRAHVAENYPHKPTVHKIILLQHTKYLGPRDVPKVPVYRRVFFGACAACQIQQHCAVCDSTCPCT